jgi:hypothetical protein
MKAASVDHGGLAGDGPDKGHHLAGDGDDDLINVFAPGN